MKIPGWILVVALVAALVAGFIAGRASGGIDDQALRDELAAYKRQRTVDLAISEARRKVLAQLEAKVAGANARGNRWRDSARTNEAIADQHGALADSLLQQLAAATTPRDSNTILLNACRERTQECAKIREANGNLRKAALEDSTAKAGLADQVTEYRSQRTVDSTGLVTADALITKLERAVRGCRLPLVSIPCPVLVGEYSLDDQAIRAGGGIPISLGRFGHATFTVTTKVGGRKP